MKQRVYFLFILMLLVTYSFSQYEVGIGANTPHQSAVLHIESTDKGLLIPRMTNMQIDSIVNPATGLLVYSLDDGCIHIYRDSLWLKNCGFNFSQTTTVPPTFDNWSVISDFPGVGRWEAVAFTIGQEAFVGTGLDNAVRKDFYKYDSTMDTWTQVSDLLGTVRTGAVSFQIGQEAFVGTGNDVGGLRKDFFKYKLEDYFLTLNAEGEVDWLKVSVTDWNTSGSDIHNVNDGNVGIGTSSPSTKLDVEGGIAIGSSYSGTSTAPTNGAIFEGKVAIGTSDPGNYQLKIVEPSAFGLLLEKSSTGNGWEFYVSTDNNLRLYYNIFLKGSFDDVSGAYTTSSDARLKTRIQPINKVLPRLMKLRPKSYHFKGQKTDDKRYLGFLAQEVEPWFPELVYQSNDERTKGIYTLDYSGFGILAVQAIQEQQIIIDKQQTLIATQQTQIEKIVKALEKAGIGVE